MAILTREDYEFEKEEDFLRVCHGFAAHILHAARRELARRSGRPLRETTPSFEFRGLAGAELTTYLSEVRRLVTTELTESDRLLIERTANDETEAYENAAAANRGRVALHRARRKLVGLSGWIKG